jgi:hypothetical protein
MIYGEKGKLTGYIKKQGNVIGATTIEIAKNKLLKLKGDFLENFN